MQAFFSLKICSSGYNDFFWQNLTDFFLLTEILFFWRVFGLELERGLSGVRKEMRPGRWSCNIRLGRGRRLGFAGPLEAREGSDATAEG